MGIQLRPDEALAALYRINPAKASVLEELLLNAVVEIGEEITAALPNTEILCYPWHSRDEEQTFLGIHAIDENLPMPGALAGFDDSGWDGRPDAAATVVSAVPLSWEADSILGEDSMTAVSAFGSYLIFDRGDYWGAMIRGSDDHEPCNDQEAAKAWCEADRHAKMAVFVSAELRNVQLSNFVSKE